VEQASNRGGVATVQNDVGVENAISSVIGVGLCFHSGSCKLFSIMYGRLMVCSQKICSPKVEKW
jgi:hypothetical protein